MRATVGDDVLDEGVAVCYAGNTGEVTLEIPKNESADKREILFEYEWKGEWFPIGIGTQGGYGVTGGKVEPAGDIPGEGGEYSITLYGSFPAEGVKIYATSDGKSLMSGTVFKADTPVKLTVPANESYDARTVVFQYEWKGERFDIETRTQAAGYSFTNAAVTPAGDIPGEGKTYSLTLTGLLPSDGVEVRAQSGGTALVSGKVTASGQAVSLAVPGNMSYNTRTVVFEYLWNGTWTKIGDSRTQAGCSVTAATHNAPATIPGQGGSYNVTLTGVLPAAGVDVRASSGGTALVTGKVTASGTAVSLTIPGQLSYDTRTVTFEYNWNGTWTKIGADCTQQGWHVTKASVSPAGYIPVAGGTYTVTLEGWGGYQIRAMSGSAQLVINTNAPGNSADYSASITIPANPSAATRSVTFQYFLNGTWRTIESRTQDLDQSNGISWETCQDRCVALGRSLLTRNEMLEASWDGWPLYRGSVPLVYWSELDSEDGAWNYEPAGGQFLVYPTFVIDTTMRCRCTNE